MTERSRRSFLAATAALSVAGCLGGPSGTATRSPSPAGAGTPTRSGTATPTDTPRPPSLDAVDGDWPTPAFDPGRTHFDPDGRVPASPPRAAWTAEYGGDSGSVVVADGTVYVGAHRHVVAFDAATGERRWSRSFDGRVRGPVVGQYVLVGVGGEIRALSPDGERRWTVATERGPVRQLVPAGRSVFATTAGSESAPAAVVAIWNQTRRWTADADDHSVQRFRGVAVGDDVVFTIGRGGGSVATHHVLSRADGTERWQTDGVSHAVAPTVADDVVLAGGFYGDVAAQAVADGSERWRVQVGPAVGTVGVAGDAAYATGHDADGDGLYALDVASGIEQWTAGPAGGLLGAGEALVVGGDGRLLALERASGEQRWVRDVENWNPTGLALADGVLFAAGDDGRLRALV